MRFAPALFALLATAVSLSAQEQERTLYERITKPNTGLTFDLRKGSVGAASRTFEAGTAATKDFRFQQRYTPSKYRTREFAGSKDAWMGDFTFSTKQANSHGKYELRDASKQAPTKTAATKEAWDAGKKVATRDLRDGNRQYLGPEAKPRGQTKLDGRGAAAQADPSLGWQGSALKELTIDDVRELLNKSK